MAIIVIKDLQENVELDRQAMLAIAGGSRLRSGPLRAQRAVVRSQRLFQLAAPAAPRRASPA